ncbi:MAG: helix-turn-helix transcriptional regulator, partial [Bacteroidetes bacterium]|nr:helix-turn-helix transcriptional regulator [Bacteroidota bacterium]
NYHLKESVVSGVRSTYFSFAPESEFFMAGLRFTLFGFYHLFHIPASHFKDQNFDSKDVWGKEIELLREQLLEATDNENLIQTLDHWAFQKAIKSDLHEIQKWKHVESRISQPGIQVGSVLSQIMGYSHKHSIQLFKEKAGVNPKLIQDVNRFELALQMMSSPQTPGFIPHTYADQSHFIREFKRFTGFTPRDYIKNKPKTFLLYQELEDFQHSDEMR